MNWHTGNQENTFYRQTSSANRAEFSRFEFKRYVSNLSNLEQILNKLNTDLLFLCNQQHIADYTFFVEGILNSHDFSIKVTIFFNSRTYNYSFKRILDVLGEFNSLPAKKVLRKKRPSFNLAKILFNFIKNPFWTVIIVILILIVSSIVDQLLLTNKNGLEFLKLQFCNSFKPSKNQQDEP